MYKCTWHSSTQAEYPCDSCEIYAASHVGGAGRIDTHVASHGASCERVVTELRNIYRSGATQRGSTYGQAAQEGVYPLPAARPCAPEGGYMAPARGGGSKIYAPLAEGGLGSMLDGRRGGLGSALKPHRPSPGPERVKARERERKSWRESVV